MSDYFTAHTERMQRNDKALHELAANVIKEDPTIEAYFHHDDSLKSNVLFFKGENINSVSFHEVPYHWSGCGIKDHSSGDNVSMPFDVNDVLTTFHPITGILKYQPNVYFKSKEQYLKWYSFYKRWYNE